MTGFCHSDSSGNLANEAPKTVQDVYVVHRVDVGMVAYAKGGGSLQITWSTFIYTDGGHNDTLIILDGMMFMENFPNSIRMTLRKLMY